MPIIDQLKALLRRSSLHPSPPNVSTTARQITASQVEEAWKVWNKHANRRMAKLFRDSVVEVSLEWIKAQTSSRIKRSEPNGWNLDGVPFLPTTWDSENQPKP